MQSSTKICFAPNFVFWCQQKIAEPDLRMCSGYTHPKYILNLHVALFQSHAGGRERRSGTSLI